MSCFPHDICHVSKIRPGYYKKDHPHTTHGGGFEQEKKIKHLADGWDILRYVKARNSGYGFEPNQTYLS